MEDRRTSIIHLLSSIFDLRSIVGPFASLKGKRRSVVVGRNWVLRATSPSAIMTVALAEETVAAYDDEARGSIASGLDLRRRAGRKRSAASALLPSCAGSGC